MILFHRSETQWKPMAADKIFSLNSSYFESDPES